MREYEFNNFFIKIASRVGSKLEDLTPLQFIRISGILFSNKPAVEKEVYILANLLGIRWFEFRKKFQLRRLSNEQFLELFDFSMIFFRDDIKTKACIIPSISCGLLGKLSGPYRDLTNQTFGDFRNQCDYMKLFESKKDPQYLDKFVAMIYNSYNLKFLRIRKRDENYRFLQRVEEISNINPEVKSAIYHNYILMLNYITPMFPHIFSKKKPKKEGEEKTTKPRDVYWHQLIKEWCDNKPEDYSRKDKLPMLVALDSLNELIRRSKQRKTKPKKRRR